MGGTTLDAAIMDAILHKVNNWVLQQNCEERKSLLQIVDFFKTLSTELAKSQRPLMELSLSVSQIF